MQAEQDALFDLDAYPAPSPVPALSKREKFALKLVRMHARHGKGPEGRQCQECAHFTQQGGVAGTYFKCQQYGVTGGPGTDWRARWPACGLFVEAAHAG